MSGMRMRTGWGAGGGGDKESKHSISDLWFSKKIIIFLYNASIYKISTLKTYRSGIPGYKRRWDKIKFIAKINVSVYR